MRRPSRSDAVEISWIFRFYAARRRGRKSARLIRQQRETATRSFTYAPKHPLHQASTP